MNDCFTSRFSLLKHNNYNAFSSDAVRKQKGTLLYRCYPSVLHVPLFMKRFLFLLMPRCFQLLPPCAPLHGILRVPPIEAFSFHLVFSKSCPVHSVYTFYHLNVFLPETFSSAHRYPAAPVSLPLSDTVPSSICRKPLLPRPAAHAACRFRPFRQSPSPALSSASKICNRLLSASPSFPRHLRSQNLRSTVLYKYNLLHSPARTNRQMLSSPEAHRPVPYAPAPAARPFHTSVRKNTFHTPHGC